MRGAGIDAPHAILLASLSESLHPREPEMPHATRLDDEARDASLRVASDIDDIAAAAREAILVRRFERAEPPVARIHDELSLLDLPRLRRLYLVAPIVPRVLGELRCGERDGVGTREGDCLARRADDHARRHGAVSLEMQLRVVPRAVAAATEGHDATALTSAGGEERVANESRPTHLTSLDITPDPGERAQVCRRNVSARSARERHGPRGCAVGLHTIGEIDPRDLARERVGTGRREVAERSDGEVLVGEAEKVAAIPRPTSTV